MEAKNDFKYISQLIIKFLKDELNDQEKTTLELWLNASPQNRELLESFRNTAQVQQEINYTDAVDPDKGWEEISKQIRVKPAKISPWTKIMKYSAAAVLAIAVGFGIYTYALKSTKGGLSEALVSQDVMPGSQKAVLQMADGSIVDLGKAPLSLKSKDGATVGVKNGTLVYNDKAIQHKKNGYNSLKTPRAGEYRMVLPDGTKVWLNASSTLNFPTAFNKSERRVQLKGEAYFEVAHNPALPFIVSFNNTQVEVLGTRFNINSYEKYGKTTLIEGSVKITEGTQQRILTPGRQAFSYDGHLTIKASDTYKSIAWKEGVFYFKEDRMKDILDQVSRWYDVDIVYNGSPGRKRYSGTIRRQATLNQVLEMLKTVSNTDYRLENKTVTVNFNE